MSMKTVFSRTVISCLHSLKILIQDKKDAKLLRRRLMREVNHVFKISYNLMGKVRCKEKRKENQYLKEMIVHIFVTSLWAIKYIKGV